MFPPDLLSNKTAIITGGGQGLGKATATLLNRCGASVAVTWFADSEGLNRQRAEATVAELGDRALAVEGDVRDRQSIGAAIKAATARFGSLDIVVNNAAVLRDRTMKKMSDDDWQQVIDTNLTGVWNTCREALSNISNGGRIVSMASISGFTGFFGQTNYSAAKAGVVGLTRALSRELSHRDITVNAVAPGVVLTEMGESIPESARQQMLSQIPLGRFGDPEDVANAIMFLCSPMAAYITGQTIHVNGGWIG